MNPPFCWDKQNLGSVFLGSAVVKSWLWLPPKQIQGLGTVRVIPGGTAGFEGLK